jgi:hypothetical protein
MKARSPFFIERMFFSAVGLATPSQVVRLSRTRSSHEYVDGSVFSSHFATRALPCSMFDQVIEPIAGGPAGARLALPAPPPPA